MIIARRTGALLLLLLALLSSGIASAQKSKFNRAELIQHRLGSKYAQWLVGPLARMASRAEVDEFLGLSSDDEAAIFVEEFWRRRDPDPSQESNPVRELYEQRAAVADSQFTEAAYSGRRTDRGTVLILYGEPEHKEFEEFRDVDEPDVELWKYPKKADEGLDGRRPERQYRFARRGDLTSFYQPRDPSDIRNRLGREPRLPSTGRGRFPSDPP